MVLFIFVVMMLNLGKAGVKQEQKWLSPSMWIAPSIFALILLVEFIYLLSIGTPEAIAPKEIEPWELGRSLFSTYLIAVELTALLLMAGIVGSYHLGRKKKKAVHRYIKEEMSHGSTS